MASDIEPVHETEASLSGRIAREEPHSEAEPSPPATSVTLSRLSRLAGGSAAPPADLGGLAHGTAGAARTQLLGALQRSHGNLASARTLEHRSSTFSDLAVQTSPLAGSADAGSPMAPPATTTSLPPAAAVTPLIVEDDAKELSEGQLRKSAFLEEVQREICGVLEPILFLVGQTTEGCPYLAQLFPVLQRRTAAYLDRVVKSFAPELAQPTSPRDYIPFILSRARSSAQEWALTGRITGLPPELPASWAELIRQAPGVAPAGLVQRMAESGGAPAAADPYAVQAQLGPGTPIDGGVAARMGTAFGADFSGVRTHADARAASLSRSLQARAFTVGSHVAFGAGEYRPGTVVGDSLIAHELAHTLQQKNAVSAATESQGGRTEQLESEANEFAAGATKTLWGDGNARGARARLSRTSAQAGLQLQRCDIGEEEEDVEEAEPDVIGTDAMRKRGFWIDSPGGEVTMGRTYALRLQTPPYVVATGAPTPYWNSEWFAKPPGAEEFGSRHAIGFTSSWTLDKEGEWSFAVQVYLSPSEVGIIRHTVTVRPPKEVSAEKVSALSSVDVTGFFVRLELQHLQNIHLGATEQKTGDAYISLTGQNPGYSGTTNSYTAHPPEGVQPARYQWLAIPHDLSDYPTKEYYGFRRRTISGRDGFDLGTGATARWYLAYSGITDIHCLMFDDQGGTLAEAKYRQVLLTKEEREHARKFQTYAGEAREELKKLRPDSAVHLKAVHIATETGASTELTLFVGKPVSGSGFRIMDLTPGVQVREHEGDTFDEVIKHFNNWNTYPPGHLRLRVPENTLGIATDDYLFTTTGASVAQQLSSGWGWASLGLAGLGVLAAVIPGTQPLAPAFFLASAAVGAASAGASLYHRSQEAHPSGFGIAIDIASLAGSMLGLAGAANILRHGPRVAAITRTGRFVLYTGFATDAVGGVFIAVEGATDIAAILEGPGTPDQKASAIVRILSGLLLNGAMLAWGAKDLKASRANLEGIVGKDAIGGLRGADVHALSVLEGAAMGRLAGASKEELESIATLIREDPVRAARMVEQYGERFVVGARSAPRSLEELAQALQAGHPEAAGTRGSYKDYGGTGPRPVYIEKPGSRETKPKYLAERIKSSFLTKGSNVERKLLHKAELKAGPVPTPTPPDFIQTQYSLVIPADGARPEIQIPVRIEATATKPKSVHGKETGPARMEVTSSVDSSGKRQYKALIEVHEDLAKGDVRHAVGHELDELILMAIQGVSGAGITAQKRASLLRAHPSGGKGGPPSITAHDEAAAHEFARAAEVLSPVGGRSTTYGPYGMPEDMLSRALSMGFGGTGFLEDKIALLRRAGVDEDMLKRLRTMAHYTELEPTLKASTVRSPRVIGHLLFAGKGTTKSPVGGGHLDSVITAHQAELVAKDQGVHLLPTADPPRPLGGINYKAYEQWRWTGVGDPPAASRPTTPGTTPGAKHGDWVLAQEPKTTFDNLHAFLIHADATWADYIATVGKPAPGSTNVSWHHQIPGSNQAVGGYFNVDSSGVVTHVSMYPYRTSLTSW